METSRCNNRPGITFQNPICELFSIPRKAGDSYRRNTVDNPGVSTMGKISKRKVTEAEVPNQNQLSGINNKGKGQSGNSREREKTHSVNIAFTALRTLIPTEPADRKLSKIETLRLASSYISHLSSQLTTDQQCLPNPSNNQQSKICTFCMSDFKKTRIQKPEIPTPINYHEEMDPMYPLLDLDVSAVPIISNNNVFY